MRIAIIGYGNSGMALTCELSKYHDVHVITSKSELPSQVTSYNVNDSTEILSEVKRIKYEDLQDMDCLWVTTPVNQHIKDVLENLSNVTLSPETLIIFSPGQGELETLLNNYSLNKSKVVCILPMPFNCRQVNLTQVNVLFLKRNFIWFGDSLHQSKLESVLKFSKSVIHEDENLSKVDLFSINPILHSARLFCELRRRDWNIKSRFNSTDLFYDFKDEEIELINLMSNEISQCTTTKFNLNIFLKDFVYEWFESSELQFYHNHPAYHGIQFPVDENGYLNLSSRYFTEDIPGLRALENEIFKQGHDCPMIRQVREKLEAFL